MRTAVGRSLKTPNDHSTARRVVAVARRQFFAHGFRSVSMDDLAAELGMSKKTLYAAFPSKTALVEAVLHEKFRGVEADLRRATSEHSANVVAGLHHLLACVQQHTAEIQPAFVRDIGRDTPELFAFVERRRRDVIGRYFGRLFEEGRKAGVIRKDIPPHLIIEILLGAVQSIMNPAKMAELGLTPKTGFAMIITVFLKGVVTGTARGKL